MDAYPTAASPFVSESGYTSSYDSRTKGLVTFSRLSVEGRTDFRTRTLYYDAKGNVIQRVESDGLGVLRVSTAYSFTGNPVKSRETYVPSGSLSGDTVERTWTYDLRDRLSEETVRVNSGEKVTISYAYDALGRPSGSTVSSSGASLSSSVTLDLQGRERTRTVTAGGTRLFGSELRYHDAELAGSSAQYSGGISEWEWSRGTASPKAYSFSYDGLSRLTGSSLYEDGTKTDRFTESGMTYDLNGNMMSLTRTVGSVPTTFPSSYSGNRRSGYSYDANGNVVEDSFSGLSLQWNRCGRIQKVSSGGTVLVNYSYLSDGIKVSALRSDGSGLMYVGSLTYRCEDGLPVSLEDVSFNGGRFVASSDSSGGITMTPHFYSTDHLGSVRAVTDGVTGEVLETSDYYPFGGRWDDFTSQTAAENRYRYNGKEEQATFGTPYSDYGARHYSAATGRWLAIDPLAEKYYSVSPYAFCDNNPINYVDPDGRFPDIIWDVASIGMGISTLSKTYIPETCEARLEMDSAL